MKKNYLDKSSPPSVCQAENGQKLLAPFLCHPLCPQGFIYLWTDHEHSPRFLEPGIPHLLFISLLEGTVRALVTILGKPPSSLA